MRERWNITEFLSRLAKGVLTAFTLTQLVATYAQGDDEATTSEDPRKSYGFFYDANTDRYYSNAKSLFTIRPMSSEAPVDRIEISVDDKDFSPYNGKLNFSEEGPHKIRFRASDPVLNWSPIQSFSLYVDLTPPKSVPNWIGATHSREQQTYISPNTKLNISSQDAMSGIGQILWRKPNGRVGVLKNNSRFGKEGPYTLDVAAVDNVGNQEAWFTVNFSVDASAPTSKATLEGHASKTQTGLFLNSGSRIVLSSTDTLSGVNQIEFQINNGEIQSYSTPIGISANNVVLKYRATDYVGNAEEWKTFSVRQDPIPPVVKIAQKGKSVTLAGVIYALSGFTMELEASDNESGLKEVQTTMNSRDFKATELRKFIFDRTGRYDFTVRAVDLVGNIKESNPYRIVIDSDPPTSELKSTAQLVEKDGIHISATPNKLSFKGYDEGVGFDFVEVSYDGKSFDPLIRPISVSEWDTSKKTIFYRGVDLLGNREKTQKATILVRDTGPSVGLFVETENLPGVPLSTLKNRKPAGNGDDGASVDDDVRAPPAAGAEPRGTAPGAKPTAKPSTPSKPAAKAGSPASKPSAKAVKKGRPTAAASRAPSPALADSRERSQSGAN